MSVIGKDMGTAAHGMKTRFYFLRQTISGDEQQKDSNMLSKGIDCWLSHHLSNIYHKLNTKNNISLGNNGVLFKRQTAGNVPSRLIRVLCSSFFLLDVGTHNYAFPSLISI
jgi:hypothetical protein